MDRLPQHIADQLIDLAADSPDKEICGLLLKRNTDWEVHPITNLAGDDKRAAEFYMDPAELYEIYKTRFDDVIGVYHSHPSDDHKPSGIDIAYAQTQWRYFIIAAEKIWEWQFSMPPKGEGIDVQLVDTI